MTDVSHIVKLVYLEYRPGIPDIVTRGGPPKTDLRGKWPPGEEPSK